MGWSIWGFNPARGKRFFSSTNCSVQLLCPLGLLLKGYWSFFLGIKWPECEADHTSPSSAEVRNDWQYISAPAVCLHGMDRDNFTLTVFFSVCEHF